MRTVSYQENAVVLGIGRYTGILSNLKKDTLLLDTFPTEIGLMGSKELSEDEITSLSSFFISPNKLENTKVITIIKRDITIPTLRSLYCSVTPNKKIPITLTIVEVDLDGSVTTIGHAELKIGDESFEIRCDIDANRTILIKIQKKRKSHKNFSTKQFFLHRVLQRSLI